jgi:hypothetical protein
MCICLSLSCCKPGDQCHLMGHHDQICSRIACPPAALAGYGVYQSRDVCCSPGVAFPDGCSSRPSQCWVVESFALRTCVRDDRKCLQGYGVFPNEAACCMNGAAFPNGCANVTRAEQPCWVVDTYWPSRQCRQSRTLCKPGGARGQAYCCDVDVTSHDVHCLPCHDGCVGLALLLLARQPCGLCFHRQALTVVRYVFTFV